MLWYSHINEDSTAERWVLSQGRFNTLVVIAGSGERVMALLDTPGIERLFAVDINPDALDLLRVRLEALQKLSTEDFLKLQGHLECSPEERRGLAQQLDSSSLLTVDVGNGLMNVGALERWLRRIRPLMYLWMGSTFKLWAEHGFQPPTPKRFPWRRYRLLLWVFKLRLTYLITGNRDPAFIGSTADYARLADSFWEQMQEGTIHKNMLFHLIFMGHHRLMAPEDLPMSLRPDVLTVAKERLTNMQVSYVLGDITSPDVIDQLPWGEPGANVFTSLSDIPSFATNEQCLNTVRWASSTPGSVAVLRSFLVHRLPDDNGTDITEHEPSGLYDVRAYGMA